MFLCVCISVCTTHHDTQFHNLILSHPSVWQNPISPAVENNKHCSRTSQRVLGPVYTYRENEGHNDPGIWWDFTLNYRRRWLSDRRYLCWRRLGVSSFNVFLATIPAVGLSRLMFAFAQCELFSAEIYRQTIRAGLIEGFRFSHNKLSFT